MPALRGRDARQQLVVTARLPSGQLDDLTRQATFRAEPAGIVEIDATGLVRPQADGRAVITAQFGGLTAQTPIAVEHYVDDPPVNFPNQIVPIFTKFGCNSGGCHGKASGQNGFKLSLLGFEPGEDHEHLVKEGRGRRLFPAAPEQSLLLAKATNTVPHGGGQRLGTDSHEYRLLHPLDRQGMPYGNATDPAIERISIHPPERSMHRDGSQQVIVVAHYSDGSSEDVTRLTAIRPEQHRNGRGQRHGPGEDIEPGGRCGGHGPLSRASGRVSGECAVGRRGGQRCRPVTARIDEAVFKKLKTLGVPPSAVCDDGSFIRRVTVDIAGRLPTVDETRQFLADEDPAKRDKLIDRLLASSDYADYFASKWSAVLRNKRRTPNYARGTYAFHDWIRESLYREQALRPVRARDSHRLGRDRQQSGRGLVPRGERRRSAGRGLRAVVPRLAHSVCALPSSSVREMEPA